MVKKVDDVWEDDAGRDLCRPLSGEDCPPFIAMGHLTLTGATLDDCAYVCGQYAQEIADLHDRMRETFANLRGVRHMPSGIHEVPNGR